MCVRKRGRLQGISAVCVSKYINIGKIIQPEKQTAIALKDGRIITVIIASV